MDRSVTYFDDVAAINVSLQLMQNRSGVPCPFPVTTQLCGASYGNMWLCEGDAFRSVCAVCCQQLSWSDGDRERRYVPDLASHSRRLQRRGDHSTPQSDQHIRWMIAASASVAVGHAAMDAAIANYPEQRFSLRNGILVIRQHPKS